MTPADGDAIIAQHFAPWVQALKLRVTACDSTGASLIMPFDASLVRGGTQFQQGKAGGFICGQALMSAADTAMVIAISSALGGFRPMATASQNSSFMRAIVDKDVEIIARVLKSGKSLVFGEIEMRASGDERLAVHVTTTYALMA